MSLDLDEESAEALGYGDIYWTQMPLVRSTVTSRRKKSGPTAVKPHLRLLSLEVLIAFARKTSEDLLAARRKRDFDRRRERYATDPEYRARRNAAANKYCKTEKAKAQKRWRYANDVEYRLKQIARVYKNKALRAARGEEYWKADAEKVKAKARNKARRTA